MKNFFESLKDFLYDSIDYVMMILVVLVVALILNWKLGGLFTKDNMNIPSSKKQNETTQQESSSAKNSNEHNQKNNDKNLEETSSNEIVKITIPPGSLPLKIGSILENNGLVEDKNVFVQKVIDLNLETKLKYGDFEISKNSSIEEILNILTK
ncbi:hypothetical protein EDD65_104155 [Keratinibaculum paraultunense]|uniref:YceG-like family protein n=1 Tax=Keratinibaculum paraultunense TaxID=1278232 RepID=A0A4R3L2D5_9FIRM|nr:endolytic transglycosylase MltG [Keratinibaculum paraultunense]QQY78990.1 endolytic transglycosylase MltG [Keratinibaculum paraultunense]TCS90612.1 hypothetical protein EDD65_104155 [Keratinibaculum paraultunense]